MKELSQVLQASARLNRFRVAVRLHAMKMNRQHPKSLGKSSWSLYQGIVAACGCADDDEVFDLVGGDAECFSDSSDESYGVRYARTADVDFVEVCGKGKSFVLSMRKLDGGEDCLPEYAKRYPLIRDRF